ncbi:hypothetical protein [Parvibaculum sp.]|jgi:hypothetical protein|uniref:hypothetical protein n=1 Tax=Parvibaculum sp. TaxID=2024848 RepID=UPI0038B26B47
MKQQINPRHAFSIVVGIAAVTLLEPMLETHFLGFQYNGVVPAGVRAGLGVFLGHCAYFVWLRSTKSI